MKCQFMNIPTDFIYISTYLNIAKKKSVYNN